MLTFLVSEVPPLNDNGVLPLHLPVAPELPLLAKAANTIIIATPQKTVLACSINDIPPSMFLTGARKDSPRSSGESDATKVILKPNATKVVRKPVKRHAREPGELKRKLLEISAYVRMTRTQNIF